MRSPITSFPKKYLGKARLNQRYFIPEHDLLEVQFRSFQEFLQEDVPPHRREKKGLQKIFLTHFPVQNAQGVYVMEFLDYSIDPPRVSEEECRLQGLTYHATLKARFRIYCQDPEHAEFEPVEQEVFLGNIPYMTRHGTFIINGTERVVVSQIHRAPGVLFTTSIHPNGTRIFSVRIIPARGTWLELATDTSGVLYIYFDRKKKVPVTVVLKALGYASESQILDLFGLIERVPVRKEALERVRGKRIAARVVIFRVEEYVDEESGEVHVTRQADVLVDRGTEITDDIIRILLDYEKEVEEIFIQKEQEGYDYSILFNTLDRDPTNSEEEALEYIYQVTRGTVPPDKSEARRHLENLLFSEARCFLGEVGRYKLNRKLGLDIPSSVQVLTVDDLLAIIRRVMDLYNGHVEEDEVDSLSHRRLRTVGEQLYEQFNTGIQRLARTIADKMNIREAEVFTPEDLIQTRVLTSVIQSYLSTGQLSQFADQTNPLSFTTHKRRISALGPGGLSRENAGLEVRDVHHTHYGRLCPIETPEGPNIGLINTLAVHARLNWMGFIVTPYLRVQKGRVLLEEGPVYLSADEEEDKVIAQASVQIDQDGKILQKVVRARRNGDFILVSPEEVDYVECATNQILGLAASLIPFIEHDDANRALMGSNMQRQAVPLLIPEPPLVGTGMEAKAARDSRVLITAEGDGVVEYVDAERIVIRYERTEEEKLVSFDEDVREYRIPKFQQTNQSTCLNLRPIVRKGERVRKGQVLVEGYCTAGGELALGKNLLVAFMPWKGYNFEDAIIISERLVQEDVLTSIHIEEIEDDARITKAGPEEITRDIANVPSSRLEHLDERGLAREGTLVREGDIIIGKVVPQGEREPSPEEKLLRAIFGDKSREFRNVSKKADPGFGYGVVIGTTLLEKKQRRKDSGAEEYQKEKEALLKKRLEKQYDEKRKKLEKALLDKLEKVVGGKVSRGVYDLRGEVVIPAGETITLQVLNQLKKRGFDFVMFDPFDWTEDEQTNRLVEQIIRNYRKKRQEVDAWYRREKYRIEVGVELPPGVHQVAKVFVAKKRKIKVGDKLAGRHGNKGVIAKIARVEDMPFLEDGTPVDIVLNPLGVPSRMNIGQIYETILGWAAYKLGVRFITPSFDGPSLEEIQKYLEEAGLPPYGETYLYDGETGERFHQKVTVGMIYMMKLIHMVEDKIHARAVGPYSLITQQPLGGRSQFGGQRLGEMEVWALEAYGAAYTLQEMLTLKSDDVEGRSRAFQAITEGENLPRAGVPESFRVLVSELKGLCLDLIFE